MLFTGREIFDLTITVLVIGFIFSGYIKRNRNPLEMLSQSKWKQFLNWEDFKFSTAIVAPAIILHELGHKFAGFAYGYASYFHAWPFGLGLGAVLRIIGSPFLFFAPGYVTIPAANAVHMGAIAFAGPLVNILLFSFSWIAIKKDLWPKHRRALHISKTINLWLLIFNMIPFGPLDGAKVLNGILALL